MSGVKYLLNACELTGAAGVNLPSTDRNIWPAEPSRTVRTTLFDLTKNICAHCGTGHLDTPCPGSSRCTCACRKCSAPMKHAAPTCATCSYFPSTACTNLDGPIQTTANSPACRLYFNIGDVERGL